MRLRDLILDRRGDPIARTVATATIPILALRCGLTRAVTLPFYTKLLDALQDDENFRATFSLFVAGQLVEDACNLHPVELRPRLEAAEYPE